jgi:protein involved in polysaccharide export with SLBB domain
LAGLGTLLVLAAGCACSGDRADQLLQQKAMSFPASPIAKYYQVHCPDEVMIQAAGPHPWQGQCPIGPDGRIVLGPHGMIRVDGMTPPEIAAHVADTLIVPADKVHVEVTAHRSQQIYIFGEVAGVQRAVPYRGPETVVELLQRVGGVTPGAAPGDIQVVRSHVADGKPPEVFNVDLNAILLQNHPEGNIHIYPFDQVYIGQSKRCCLAKNMPPWLRPVFEQVCGMKDPLLQPPNGPLLSYLPRQ